MNHMVDNALLQRVMQLDEQSRLELRDAIEASVAPLSLPVKLKALLDARVADDDAADWSEYVSLDDDEQRVRTARQVA